MLKERLLKSLKEAVEETVKTKGIKIKPEIKLEVPRQKSYGDYASNVAFILAKEAREPALRIAKEVVRNFKVSGSWLEKVEVASPGFINFYLGEDSIYQELDQILKMKEDYGKSNQGKGEKVQVEFISANPTGPLHIGHGRIGAVGDVLSNLLKMVGFNVEKEFYVNDAEVSSQVENLAKSLDIRYRQLRGEEVSLPEDGYLGDYLIEVAQEIIKEEKINFSSLPLEERLKKFRELALNKMLKLQKEDLKSFGLRFDSFFSEESLYKSKEVEKTIEQLREKGYIYEKEGALWFASSKFSDEKDRVIIRANGEPTYLASDIAYHQNKFERGIERVINVWGADHHGYIPRLKAALLALGYDPKALEVIIVQMVNLQEGGEPVKMSKRAGEMITLKEILDEVGKDVARFFFITRDSNSPLDFDLELAKEKSDENPVYYVQYAYARICSIFSQAKEAGIVYSPQEADLSLLKRKEEKELIRKLVSFPEEVSLSATSREVQRIPAYTKDLSNLFHIFYHNCRVLTKEQNIVQARLSLVEATRVVLLRLFNLMGISAPQKM